MNRISWKNEEKNIKKLLHSVYEAEEFFSMLESAK